MSLQGRTWLAICAAKSRPATAIAVHSIYKSILPYHDLSDVRTLESALSLLNRILLLTQAPVLLTSEAHRLSFRLAFATLERLECTAVDPSLLS